MKGIFIYAVSVIGIAFGLMFLFILWLNSSAPENDPELVNYTEEKVKAYLMQEKGYAEDEIVSITSINTGKVSDSYASSYETMVVFADEPDATYFYDLVDDKVEQSGRNGHSNNHREIP